MIRETHALPIEAEIKWKGEEPDTFVTTVGVWICQGSWMAFIAGVEGRQRTDTPI